MVYLAPPVLGLGSFSLFFSFFFTWLSIIMSVIFMRSSIFWTLWFFLHAPIFVWTLLMIENFLLCPLVLFGHFQSLRFFSMSLALASNLRYDPSQGYFQKTLPGSKGDCKGYILVSWNDYQRWPFFIPNLCI